MKPWRTAIVLAGSVGLTGGGGGCSRPRAAASSSSCRPPATPVVAQLKYSPDNGRSYLVIDGNGDARWVGAAGDEAETGVFHTCVPTDAWAVLGDGIAALRPAPFSPEQAAPAPPPTVPGHRVVVIEATLPTAPGQYVRRAARTLDRDAPENCHLAEFFDTLDHIADTALVRPERTLRVTYSHVSVDASGTLRGTLVISNRGLRAIQLSALGTSPQPSLYVEIWPARCADPDAPGTAGCGGELRRVPIDSIEAVAPSVRPAAQPGFGKTVELAAGAWATFHLAATLTDLTIEPQRARLVWAGVDVFFGEPAPITSAPPRSPIAEVAMIGYPPPSLPRAADIVSTHLYNCGFGPAPSDADLRAIFDSARQLVIFDDARDGWAYTVPCSGTIETPSGRRAFDLFAGGRGTLTTAGGPPLRFVWSLPARPGRR